MEWFPVLESFVLLLSLPLLFKVKDWMYAKREYEHWWAENMLFSGLLWLTMLVATALTGSNLLATLSNAPLIMFGWEFAHWWWKRFIIIICSDCGTPYLWSELD